MMETPIKMDDLEIWAHWGPHILGNTHMSNGLNLLHPRKDVAEMVIVVCVSPIVPEDLMFVIKSGKHNMCIKSSNDSNSKVIVFCLCPVTRHPYDSIKYQCPGVSVPKCRHFVESEQLTHHSSPQNAKLRFFFYASDKTHQPDHRIWIRSADCKLCKGFASLAGLRLDRW